MEEGRLLFVSCRDKGHSSGVVSGDISFFWAQICVILMMKCDKKT